MLFWSGFGDHFGCFEKHSCSVHFCLMNFSDDKSDCSMLEYRWRSFEFEVGERFLASESERLTVFVCYHRAVRLL